MKAFAVVLAVTALVAAPIGVQNAHAEFEMTLGAGVNSPMGDYGDQAKTGYAITTGIGYRFMPFIVVGAEANFYGNGASDDVLDALGSGYDMKSTIQQYSGVVKVLVPVSDHNVYLKGGVGNYRGSAKFESPSGDLEINMSDFGYGLGGGFLINGARNSAFYLEATYHSVAFDEGEGDTNFIAYHAGAIFRFSP